MFFARNSISIEGRDSAKERIASRIDSASNSAAVCGPRQSATRADMNFGADRDLFLLVLRRCADSRKTDEVPDID